MSLRLTRADIDLLARVGAEDLTWRHHGMRRSFRLWSTETAYTTVTRRAQRLLCAGLIRPWHSHVSGQFSGGVELTAEGRRVLNEAGAGSATATTEGQSDG